MKRFKKCKISLLDILLKSNVQKVYIITLSCIPKFSEVVKNEHSHLLRCFCQLTVPTIHVCISGHTYVPEEKRTY
jgi:hypothetical protein